MHTKGSTSMVVKELNGCNPAKQKGVNCTCRALTKQKTITMAQAKPRDSYGTNGSKMVLEYSTIAENWAK